MEQANGMPEQVPEEAFDQPISDMLGNLKVLPNVRTTDAVWAVKLKLAAETGVEPDALKVLLTLEGDLPTQIDLEIETRS
eukprot:COSAG02_NODE_36701_length_451_cov_1.556818_1_plen_79_part_01